MNILIQLKLLLNPPFVTLAFRFPFEPTLCSTFRLFRREGGGRVFTQQGEVAVPCVT